MDAILPPPCHDFSLYFIETFHHNNTILITIIFFIHNISAVSIQNPIAGSIIFGYPSANYLQAGPASPAMASLLESSLTSNSIRRLEDRRSYMAKAPYQQHKSKMRLLHDTAMKLCPVLWLAPAIIRAHDKHEYERDKKYVQEMYVEYQEHRSRKSSLVGAGGRGSIVDLHTYLAPMEWTPWKDPRRDPWRSEKSVTEDPWQLRPMNEIV